MCTVLSQSITVLQVVFFLVAVFCSLRITFRGIQKVKSTKGSEEFIGNRVWLDPIRGMNFFYGRREYVAMVVGLAALLLAFTLPSFSTTILGNCA
jgi:hypothetical protein